MPKGVKHVKMSEMPFAGEFDLRGSVVVVVVSQVVLSTVVTVLL